AYGSCRPPRCEDGDSHRHARHGHPNHRGPLLARHCSAFDLSKYAVIMNAFIVDRTDSEPRNALVRSKCLSYAPHDILDEDRIVESLHRDVAFVRSLQQWIYRC